MYFHAANFTVHHPLKIFYSLYLLVLFLVLQTSSYGQTLNAHLQINKEQQLPFVLEKQNNDFFIVNGLEVIPLQKRIVPNTDSLDLVFPYFNSFIRCKITRRGLTGYWHNLLKSDYKIPVEARRKKIKRSQPMSKIEGKWSVTFSTKQAAYSGVGVFEIKQNKVNGTFMTETGDYRFLSGYFQKDSLILSTFNGSHAFLFKAKMTGDSLLGTFYNGKHYQTDWIAVKNDQASLRNPNALTTIDSNQNIHFTFPDLNGNYYSFPNHISSEQATIIMLMGSWCPNCIDEAIYFKTLQEQYGRDKLKIIAVCYEVGDNENIWRESVKKLADKHHFPFIFLLAGKASKLLAHQHFPMLNHVMSFPTTLYVDKKGQVRKVYTGFYGPATKTYFEDFQKETLVLLEEMMGE